MLEGPLRFFFGCIVNTGHLEDFSSDLVVVTGSFDLISVAGKEDFKSAVAQLLFVVTVGFKYAYRLG